MSGEAYAYDPIVRGDSGRIEVQVLQQDLFTGEISRVDLTGSTVTLEVAAPGQAISASTAGALLVNADLSILTRLLTPAETAALPLGTISGRWRIAFGRPTSSSPRTAPRWRPVWPRLATTSRGCKPRSST